MIVLDDDELSRTAPQFIARQRQCVVAFAKRPLRGVPLTAALFADWLVLSSEASMQIDTLPAWAAVIARIGTAARRLLLSGSVSIPPEKALQYALCDSVVAADRDPVEWLEEWIGRRSADALDSAATLLRMRGADPLESAEFGRLFATGEPQRGLDAFLRRAEPQFRRLGEPAEKRRGNDRPQRHR